jgi:Ran GTPase-activating protein (RanGAP) involved in mRNA processing and transport
MTTAVDILNSIKQQQLILENYKLSLGQCEGLKKAFEFDSGLVNRILIDNCGVDDKMLSVLIEGAFHLRKIKILNVKKTKIGLLSTEKVKKLFINTAPWHFEELRIEDC